MNSMTKKTINQIISNSNSNAFLMIPELISEVSRVFKSENVSKVLRDFSNFQYFYSPISEHRSSGTYEKFVVFKKCSRNKVEFIHHASSIEATFMREVSTDLNRSTTLLSNFKFFTPSEFRKFFKRVGKVPSVIWSGFFRKS